MYSLFKIKKTRQNMNDKNERFSEKKKQFSNSKFVEEKISYLSKISKQRKNHVSLSKRWTFSRFFKLMNNALRNTSRSDAPSI